MIFKAVKEPKVHLRTADRIFNRVKRQFSILATRVSRLFSAWMTSKCRTSAITAVKMYGSADTVTSDAAKIVGWMLEGLDCYSYHHLRWQGRESIFGISTKWRGSFQMISEIELGKEPWKEMSSNVKQKGVADRALLGIMGMRCNLK